MRNYTIELDPSAVSGKIRNILGMCNSPRIRNAKTAEKEQQYFRELAPAIVRYHDAALENPGYALIDVSRIFPLFHADPDDPRNYDFGPTDLYLQTVSECGSEIEYRLGESIEHSSRKFRVLPPADPEKWADICLHIIRHYNEGWADGMHLGIRYWSIWEEPGNNPLLFAGEFSRFLELFDVAFHRIKAAFPDLMVGGVNDAMPFCFRKGRADAFFQFCLDRKIRPDFLCWTGYGRTPDRYVEYAGMMREYAEKYGFGDVPRWISECHLAPQDWYYSTGEVRHGYDPEMHNEVSAAFAAATLIALHDAGVEIATHYSWALGNWGVLGNDGKPQKIYYGLKYFTETARCTRRLVLPELPDPEIRMLAGLTDSGSVKLLIACYRSPAAVFTLHLPGCGKCRWKRITALHEDPEQWEDLAMEEGTADLPFEEGGCGCFLLEFFREEADL